MIPSEITGQFVRLGYNHNQIAGVLYDFLCNTDLAQFPDFIDAMAAYFNDHFEAEERRRAEYIKSALIETIRSDDEKTVVGYRVIVFETDWRGCSSVYDICQVRDPDKMPSKLLQELRAMFLQRHSDVDHVYVNGHATKVVNAWEAMFALRHP